MVDLSSLTIDETTLIDHKGKTITLEDLSYETGLSLEIVLLRATKCLSSEYIASENRSVTTYECDNGYYTINELSFMFGIPCGTLFDLLVRHQLNVDNALMVIEGQRDRDNIFL